MRGEPRALIMTEFDWFRVSNNPHMIEKLTYVNPYYSYWEKMLTF